MPERTFCIYPMFDDQLAFVKGIAQNPFDQLRRDIYADWLEEHGEDEEAIRQRQWTPAYQRLCERIFDTLYEHESYGDPDHDPASYRKDLNVHEPQQQLDRIEDWALSLMEKQCAYFPFMTPEFLYEEDGRVEFCRDVEIVSGIRISPEARTVSRFRCSC